VAREAGLDSGKVPCLGHPVSTRRRSTTTPGSASSPRTWKSTRSTTCSSISTTPGPGHDGQRRDQQVHAVNVDAALGVRPDGHRVALLVDKRITVQRAVDLPFLAFALGRVAGGAGEYLDHRESGTDMDMRVPVDQCEFLGRPRIEETTMGTSICRKLIEAQPGRRGVEPGSEIAIRIDQTLTQDRHGHDGLPAVRGQWGCRRSPPRSR